MPQRKPTVRPADLVRIWVDAFNRADGEALAEFYHEDPVIIKLRRAR